MTGILIAAGITTMLVLPIIYGLWRTSKTSWVTFFLFLLQLPMSLILNLTIKSWISSTIVLLALSTLTTLVLLLFVAPFTEEAIKLGGLPLFLRSSHLLNNKMIEVEKPSKRQIQTGGIMSGLGFGVGEIWAIAILVVLFAPADAAYPWFLYQGFIIERFETVFIHGLLGLVGYWGFKKWLPLSYLGAVGLHATVNAPIIFLQLGLLNQMHIFLYVTVFSVAAIFAIILVLTTPRRQRRHH